ncbi:hypothetical protein HJFPF1_05458 [Paramyrothecium foliicola]|nr:hypothetical protein HJFPF1_05458 [Paramyrothecium foliicola]
MAHTRDRASPQRPTEQDDDFNGRLQVATGAQLRKPTPLFHPCPAPASATSVTSFVRLGSPIDRAHGLAMSLPRLVRDVCLEHSARRRRPL